MRNQPIRIGKMEITNRIVMPPIATYRSTADGKVTEDLLSYYGERAKNSHIGMIITEHSYIALRGKAKEHQLSISDDRDIPGLSRLTEVIHQGGTKAVAQLNHAGSAAPSSATGGRPVSASGIVLPTVPMMGDGVVPEQLTREQIAAVAARFADAAERAKRAGYDGAEIHSAHAYLLNQFYSPLTNHRTDEYGGTLDNRLRIHREVIRAVRERVGADYPLAIRLGGCDYMEGGSTIADAVYAAKVFEQEGIDLIDVSGGMCRYTRAGHDEPGYFQDLSAAIRNAVSVPVMLTGGIRTLRQAEQLLDAGAADLIGVGRELLKNPYWPDGAKE